MKTTLKGLLFVAALLVLAGSTAQAASITVDAGGACTLADAITAANTDTATGGCPAGAGADTISLQADVTLAATLPQITTVITIEGGGHFISGNNDSSVGSVLYVASSGNLTVNNATVKGGNTTDCGGGIYNSGGTVTLTNSTISGNTAFYDGGGIYNSGGTVTLTNSTISGNTASSFAFGGGIFNFSGGTVTLTNSTVSGNAASFHGGGIWNDSTGTVTLINSTVSGNTASSGSGGILNSGTITLRSSIISGNAASGGSKEIHNNTGTVIAASYNLFGHSGETSAEAFSGFTPGTSDVYATSDGGAPTALAAILSHLATNGGPTQTHALVAGSPAIDIDTACGTGLSTDQRGYHRPINSKCDAGAFEYDSSNTDSDGDGTADGSDNCPLIANADQKDTDKDSIGDACDPHDDRMNLAPAYYLLLKQR